jgi:hypothetical protein
MFPYLDALYLYLKSCPGLMALLDGEHLYRCRPLEQRNAALKGSLHQSLVSIEPGGLEAEPDFSSPGLVVDICSRKSYQQVLDIFDEVQKNVIDGFSQAVNGASYAIEVQSLKSEKGRWDDALQAWRLQVEVRFYVPDLLTIESLISVQSSPQVAEKDVTFICTTSDQDGEVLYRWLISGPNTSTAWKEVLGWGSQNYWTWHTEIEDSGTNTIRVQARRKSRSYGFDDSGEVIFEVVS